MEDKRSRRAMYFGWRWAFKITQDKRESWLEICNFSVRFSVIILLELLILVWIISNYTKQKQRKTFIHHTQRIEPCAKALRESFSDCVWPSMAAILRDSAITVVDVVIVRTRPRPIPLTEISMRKSIHGFLFFPIWVWCSTWQSFGPPERRL